MPQRPCRFTQSDIARALRAAKQVGVPVTVEIALDGTIRLVPTEMNPTWNQRFGSNTETERPCFEKVHAQGRLRALLFWSQERLAIAAGLGISTVYDFERDGRNVSADAVRSIRLALENAGIVLNENGGVKLRKPKEKPTT